MAVAIRLRRDGSKDRPYYRVVVADSRSRRDGKYIEVIGNYRAMESGEENYEIDLEKAEAWIKKGAQPSDTVKSIIKRARRKASA
ncbi:MAG: 30S ribosomal protein S16 [Verrucomicrobiota bacterium]